MSSNGIKGQRFLGIKNKITIAFILFLIVPIVIIVAVSAGNMGVLGANVAEISGDALESEEYRSMAEITQTKSAYIDEVFTKKGNDISTIAQFAEDIFNGVIDVNPIPSYYHTDVNPELEYIDSAEYGTTISFNASMYFLPINSSLTAEATYFRDKSAHLDVMFKQLKSNSPEYAWIYMGFEEQKMYRCYPFSEWENKSYDATGRPWYNLAVSRNTTVYTEPYMDAAGLGLMITIAKPVYFSNGTLIGVVACDLTIQSIQDNILDTEILETGYAFLIDSAGSTVSHPDLSADDTNTIITNDALEGSEFGVILNQMQSNEEGTGTYSKDGVDWFINYKTISSTGYLFAIVVPKSEIIGPAVSIRDRITSLITTQIVILIIVLGAAVVAIGVTSNYLSKRIVTPITNLTKMMNFVSKGSISREIPMEASSARDEITILTDSFQNLITMLRLGNSDYYRGDLNLARKNYSKAMEIFKLSDNKRGIGICANNLGNIFRILQDFGSAERSYLQAIDISMELKDQSSLPRRYNNLAQLYSDSNQIQKADDYFNNGIRVSETLGDRAALALLYRNLGLLKVKQNLEDEGKKLINKAYDIDTELKNNLGMAYDELYLGKAEIGTNPDGALEQLNFALEHAQDENDIRLQMNIYSEMEEIYKKKRNRAKSHQARAKSNQLRVSLIQKKFVVLTIDVSGSMIGQRIQAAVQGALEIYDNQINPQDEVAIIVFHSQSEVILHPTQKGGNEDRIRNVIRNIRATRYQTAFFDAVGDSFDLINRRISDEQKWIIALTDGMDNQSHSFSLFDRKYKGWFNFMNQDQRIGLGEYITENLMSMNLIIIGIGNELIPIEPKLGEICTRNDQGRYIPVHDLYNTKTAIRNAFGEVSDLLAQINVEEFIESD
ncbi:MAG: cache domain-containing protein [Promethearchaeota archaeon]